MKLFRCFKALGSVGAILVLSACMDIRAVDPDKGEDPVESAGIAPVPAVVVSNGEVNAYKVVFRTSLKGLTLRRTRLDAADAVGAASVSVTSDPFEDAHVVAGATYRYVWSFGDGAGDRPLGSVDVQIPLDLVLGGREIKLSDAEGAMLKKSLRMGRLIFRPGTTLTTEGQDLDVTADSIEFNGAIIRSFPEGQRAPSGSTGQVGAEGRSGGRWIFRAARATGPVRFELRGEHGGQGGVGLPPDDSLKGAPGEDGAVGKTSAVAFGYRTCGPQEKPEASSYCHRLYATCILHPSSGKAGQQGRRGFPGGAGGRGGNATILRLEISDRQTLVDAVVDDPGQGGGGGLGGDGGGGGEGGKAGEIQYPRPPGGSVDTDCTRVQHGTVGPRGDRGPRGAWGAAGAGAKIEKI